MGKVKVGSRVKVKDFGCTYTSYVDLLTDLGLKDPEKSRESYIRGWTKKGFKLKDMEYVVISKSKLTGIKVFGIMDTKGNTIAIEARGLKLI